MEKRKLKLKKTIRKFKRVFRYGNYIQKFKFKKLINDANLKNKLNYLISIKITPNNIFCVLKNFNKNKTLFLLSAGILKLKITKRKLKFASRLLIKKFLSLIYLRTKKKLSLLKLSGPKKVRKIVLKEILKYLKGSRLIIFFQEKKSFNGCKPKKQRRKKRKGLRVLK